MKWVGIAVVALAAAAFLLRPRPAAFDMKAKLAEIAKNEGTWDNQWDHAKEKIAELEAGLAKERDPIKIFQIRREIARHQLYEGTNEEAIAGFQSLLDEYRAQMPPPAAEALEGELAFAWFRLGETENCAMHHNADSCLLPIRRGGMHHLPRGSTEAVKHYAALLADPAIDSENAYSYRWLLNLGYMTLGGYPEKVPKQWLIPPAAFASGSDIGRFEDVAADRGIAEFGAAGGLILEDFDNDGALDVLVSHMGVEDQLEYFHNDGKGHFTRRTKEAGLTGIVGGIDMFQADYDNDGCIDVFIPRGGWLHDHGKFPASLLHNNCDGTFTDVTAKAGLLAYGPSMTATWADFDGDGYLDLFVGYEIDRKNVNWPPETRNFALYLNNRDGTFRDASAESGIMLDGVVKASVSGDYDNDGRPDIYVSLLGKPNKLYRNLGGGKFEDVTARAGVAEPVMSFTTWFFDYDNDGWPDIFVTGYFATLSDVAREVLGDKANARGERPRLYHNNRDGTFTDMSREAHLDQLLLTMGANFGDLDNDGYPDFYLGTGASILTALVPNRMFHNVEGRTFEDVTTSGGFGHLQKGHGVAFGDVQHFENLAVDRTYQIREDQSALAAR
ncbi:MAG: FG-GAP-like repeat-containing protein [Myxococcales bacterium]|nr:FG-GAP-like repeat-containing protein [Myxococcales bacterium]